MKLVLLNHRDSFTYNLVHELGVLTGHRARVIDSHRATPADVLGHDHADRPDLLILSAGPGHPANAADAGISLAVLRAAPADLPVFGVCFGLQLLVHAGGGKVVPAAEILHGKSLPVHHSGTGMFRDLPDPVSMMHYNSWVADTRSLSPEWHVEATSERHEVMAISHVHRPWWAVQFHPESVGSPQGSRLLKNLLEEVHRWRSRSCDSATSL